MHLVHKLPAEEWCVNISDNLLFNSDYCIEWCICTSNSLINICLKFSSERNSSILGIKDFMLKAFEETEEGKREEVPSSSALSNFATHSGLTCLIKSSTFPTDDVGSNSDLTLRKDLLSVPWITFFSTFRHHRYRFTK